MSTRQTVLIAACLGLLLCSPLLANPLDKEQVSARAKWVLHADVQTFLASKTGGFILNEFKKSGLDKWMVVVKNAVGIDPSKDLEGVTVYGVDFEKDNGIVLVRATMEQDKLLALLKTNETYRESKYGDHVIHQWTEKAKGDKPGEMRFGCFHQADLAVVAPRLAMLKLALDVLDKKADSLTKVGESKLLPAPAKGIFLTAAVVGLPQAAKQDPKAAVLALISSARFQVGESEDKVFVRLAVTTKTPRIATDLRKMAEGFLAFLDIAKQIEENGKPVLPSEMAAVLKGVSVTVNDRTVEANVRSGTSDVISLLQWMIKHKKAAAKAASVTAAEPAQ